MKKIIKIKNSVDKSEQMKMLKDLMNRKVDPRNCQNAVQRNNETENI